MQKGQLSTSSDNSGAFSNKANEAQLMQIIKNLQLELGYHVMALKKAQQMMQLLQKDNRLLKKENQQLKQHCHDLQYRIVKFQNQLSFINQSSSNLYNECFPPGFKNKKQFNKSPFKNIQINAARQDISPNIKASHFIIDPQNTFKQKTKYQEKKNYLNTQPFEIQFQESVQLKTHSPCKSAKNYVKISSYRQENIPQKGQEIKSFSFIPFQQLQFKTKYS